MLFSCILENLGYFPTLPPGEKDHILKDVFYILLCVLVFFRFLRILRPPTLSRDVPNPTLSRDVPNPTLSRDVPNISNRSKKSRHPRKFQAVRFSPTFRVGRGVRGCSCLYFVFFFIFYFCILYFFYFLFFVFCILYFFIFYFCILDIPSYSVEFFESFEFFDFAFFPFVSISIYSRYSLHTIPWIDYDFFLFCFHISNLSTI